MTEHACGTRKIALAVFFSFAGLPGMSGNIIDVSNWRKVELFKTQMWACGVILILFLPLSVFLSLFSMSLSLSFSSYVEKFKARNRKTRLL